LKLHALGFIPLYRNLEFRTVIFKRDEVQPGIGNKWLVRILVILILTLSVYIMLEMGVRSWGMYLTIILFIGTIFYLRYKNL